MVPRVFLLHFHSTSLIVEHGDRVNGIKVFLDYNKPGEHKVSFKIDLNDTESLNAGEG